jgi:hypothetical protein
MGEGGGEVGGGGVRLRQLVSFLFAMTTIAVVSRTLVSLLQEKTVKDDINYHSLSHFMPAPCRLCVLHRYQV